MIRKANVFLAAMVVLSLAVIGCAAAADDVCNTNVIHATGNGVVIGTPDRAQLTFSVQTENTDVKVAQAENSKKMNDVINALVSAGIPKDALKTTGYNIYPVYDEEKSLLDHKVKTYRVTNTLTVTLHEVSRAGDVLDIAISNGINQAESIQFMLSDEQSQMLRTQALQKAVARARADADTVAVAMGTNITGVQNADISGGYTPVVYQNYQYDAGTAMKAIQGPTPIEPGDISVTAQVTITYTIR